MTQPDKTLERMVLELAAKVGPGGFSIQDVDGSIYTTRQIDACCRRLIRLGQLFRGKIAHRTMRIFAELQWAHDYERTKRTAGRLSQPGQPNNRTRASWAPDAQAVYPVDENGEPLYKITVAPPPPERPLRTNTHSNWGG